MEELYNIAVERSILSSFIFSPETLEDAVGILEPSMFYMPFNQKVYSVILKLHSKEMPIDEAFIENALKKENSFNELEMLEILSASSLTSVENHINLIIELSKKRELLALSTSIKKEVIEDKKETEDIASKITKKVEEISSKGVLLAKDTGYYIDSFIAGLEKAKEGKSGLIESGLNALDVKIGGFNPGDLVVVAARPSMGKTSFATTLTNNALNKNIGVYFSSLEMGGDKIIRRLVATKAKESLSDLNRGVIKDYNAYKDAIDFYRNAPLFLDDETYLTIQQLKAKAIRVFRKNKNIKIWVIDHIRYIKKPGVNIANEVSDITKEIKKIAKDYGVTVFLLSQLNRANEQRGDKRPMLSDLRESGAVEEDADVVVGLHRESYYLRNKVGREPDVAEAELIVLKNRDGASGVCKVNFNAPSATFENIGAVEYVYESGSKNVDMPRIL